MGNNVASRIKELEEECLKNGISLDQLIESHISDKEKDPRSVGRGEIIAKLLAFRRNNG